MEFMREFPDDAACLDWLWRPDTRPTVSTPTARSASRTGRSSGTTTTQQRQSWTCTACGHHVHPTAGTIFHKSSTSLHLWFYAMYLMTSTRCGISAKQLERELGVTYKTAWRMFHLIRNELMAQDDDAAVRRGRDGRDVRRRQAARRGKPMTRRKEHARPQDESCSARSSAAGSVRAQVVDCQAATRTRQVRDVTSCPPRSSTPTSTRPTRASEQRLPRTSAINHSAKVYVSGDVHTQTIEGFWSLVKRGIRGTHHSVSAKHFRGT